MLEALARGRTVQDAVVRLVEEFEGTTPAEIERDLCDFCADLLQRGLIEAHRNGDR
jgi:hypothetical protein